MYMVGCSAHGDCLTSVVVQCFCDICMHFVEMFLWQYLRPTFGGEHEMCINLR